MSELSKRELRLESLEEFLVRAADWSDGNFPQATLHSIAEHLRREAEEFQKETVTTHHGGERRIEADSAYAPADLELADIFLLTIHAARRRRISLLRVAQHKLAINQKRQWGVPDSDGVVEHIREGTDG